MLVSSSTVTSSRLNTATTGAFRESSSIRLSTGNDVWDYIKQQLQAQIPEEATKLIIESMRPTTRSQYATYIIQFIAFVKKQLKDCEYTDLLAFLSKLYHEKRLQYSALNTARSAISTLMDLLKGEPLGQHHLVRRFMKGVFHQRPSIPKHKAIWDPDILLKYLDKDSNSLTLLDFSRKIATLLTLLSGNRVITIASLYLTDVHFEHNKIVIIPSVLGKTSKPGKAPCSLEFRSFADKPNLCMVSQLKLYLKKTTEKRTDNANTYRLLLTTTPPYHNATRNTVANWIRHCLNQAGICNDKAIYTPHSLRSASTSKASTVMPVDDILKAAGWSSASTFYRFYKRDIETRSDSCLDQTLLNQYKNNTTNDMPSTSSI